MADCRRDPTGRHPAGRPDVTSVGPGPHESLVRRGHHDAGGAGGQSRRFDRPARPARRHARAVASAVVASLASDLRFVRPGRPVLQRCLRACHGLGHLRAWPPGVRRGHRTLGRLAGRRVPAPGLLRPGSADVRLAGSLDLPVVARLALISTCGQTGSVLDYGCS